MRGCSMYCPLGCLLGRCDGGPKRLFGRRSLSLVHFSALSLCPLPCSLSTRATRTFCSREARRDARPPTTTSLKDPHLPSRPHPPLLLLNTPHHYRHTHSPQNSTVTMLEARLPEAGLVSKPRQGGHSTRPAGAFGPLCVCSHPASPPTQLSFIRRPFSPYAQQPAQASPRL